MGTTFQRCLEFKSVSLGYTSNGRQPDFGNIVRLGFVFKLTDRYPEESKISN
jgi:hypothetical protein